MPAGSPLGDRPTFLLERFAWGAPDRLEVAGTFSGVPAWSVAEPVLAVHGEDGPRRLPAVPHDGTGTQDDGRWTAAFGWLEAPVAFERAQLEFGAGLSVALPAPGDQPAGPLPVAVAGEGHEPVPAPDEDGEVEGAVHRLTLEAQELERTLAAAAGARAKASELAMTEIATLRRRVAELESSGGALARARAELEQLTGQLAAAYDERDAAVRAAEAARGEAEVLRRALADARAGAQDLLDRLARADPPAGGR